MKTRRKKTIILLVFLLMLIPVSVKAASAVNTLIVLTKDHVEHRFALTDKPKVTFEGKNLKVKGSKTSATFALSDVVRFTYKKIDPTGVDELKDEQTGLNFEDGVLVITNLKANSSVGVYTLDGKPVQQLKAVRTGTFRLSLSQLPSGVYVVKAGTITYKIAKP
ncbi:MAG: T9SS type A sorting domain-containing protein [Prevotella sp.]|nr:T9SS type A sorting domain-containing protein [Prevotella sp.]